MRKRRVIGRIYGIKYSWKGHKYRGRHKNRIKRRGQARLVYVWDINPNVPGTRRWAQKDNQPWQNRQAPRHRDTTRENVVNYVSYNQDRLYTPWAGWTTNSGCVWRRKPGRSCRLMRFTHNTPQHLHRRHSGLRVSIEGKARQPTWNGRASTNPLASPEASN